MNAAELMQMIGVVGQMSGPNGLSTAQLIDASPAATGPLATAPTVAVPAQQVTAPTGYAANTGDLVEQGPGGVKPIHAAPTAPAKKGGFGLGNILTALLGSNFGQ